MGRQASANNELEPIMWSEVPICHFTGYTKPTRFVSSRPNPDNLFSIAYKNTLAKRFSLSPSNSVQFRHCRHKTLHLLEPPPSAARVAPPRWRGTTLTL